MGYEYANARLRALKSRLFDRRTYGELLALTRLDDLIARLAQSVYAAEIHDALARYRGSRVVMEACRLHLAYTLHRMQSLFEGDERRLVGVLLAGWDLFNLKMILRGHEAGVSPNVILEELSPIGRLDDNALRALVRQTDVQVVTTLLSGCEPGYGQALRNALAVLAKHHDWMMFETALDRAFMAWRLGALRSGNENESMLAAYLSRAIDAANLMSALRLRQEQTEHPMRPGEFLLDGGTVPLSWFMPLVEMQRDADVLASIRNAPFGAALSGLDSLNVERVQRALDRENARFGVSYFQRDPLSIATAIGFAAAKQVETSNVRLIAQAIALGMAREEIEEDLILV